MDVIQVIGNSAVGGAERHLLDLSLGLRELGAHIEVIVPRAGPLSERLQNAGLAWRCIEMVRPVGNDDYALDQDVLREFEAYFSQRRPDVVHSHLYPAHLHASLAARRAEVPLIMRTAHTLVVRDADPQLARATGCHTIAVAEAVLRRHEQAGTPRDRLHLIYNGVSPSPSDRATGRTPGLLGTLSRLSREKGVDVLLRAVDDARRRRPDIRLLVAGQGPELPVLRRLAADLAITPAVEFVGHVEDVDRFFQQLDLFVLPSREEACPMVALEAMTTGTPVLATAVGGVPEVVGHDRSGWLVPPNDPQAFATAIVSLIDDPQRLRHYGREGRAMVERKFTRERMVEKTFELYQSLLQGANTAALPQGAFVGYR